MGGGDSAVPVDEVVAAPLAEPGEILAGRSAVGAEFGGGRQGFGGHAVAAHLAPVVGFGPVTVTDLQSVVS